MVNHSSWIVGNSMVTLLGRIIILWPIQQMGSTDAIFLPWDAPSNSDYPRHDLHEICNARYSDSKE